MYYTCNINNKCPIIHLFAICCKTCLKKKSIQKTKESVTLSFIEYYNNDYFFIRVKNKTLFVKADRTSLY